MPKTLENAKKFKEQKKLAILQAAIKATEKTHILDLKRRDITAEAKISEGLINYYFHGMPCLREEILIEGIKQGSIEITAQAMGLFHSAAREVPRKQKLAALKLIGKKNGLRNIGN